MVTEKETTPGQVALSIGRAWTQFKTVVQDIAAKRSTARGNSLWQVGWLPAAIIIAGGFNYLANVLVGKLLGPEEYGVYAARNKNTPSNIIAIYINGGSIKQIIDGIFQSAQSWSGV